MGHSYAEQTIKLLFGSASHCAYPQCTDPLIFKDRGRLTVVAQVAHIRSEKPNGPRYDEDYDESRLDTFENLLLLCGRHHAPVDQHASVYSTEELEEWKAAQTAQTGRLLPEDELLELIATLEDVTRAQARRAALRSVWDTFSAAGLPFLEHTQGAVSSDAEHLSRQLVTDRHTFDAALAAVLREGPTDMVGLAHAVEEGCDALIRHADRYGRGWIAWRELDGARSGPYPDSFAGIWALDRLHVLSRSTDGGKPASEAAYAEAEAALSEVPGLTATHTRDLLEDACRPESRSAVVSDLTSARELFNDALEQFETRAHFHLAAAP